MKNIDPLRYALEINPWTPADDLREATLWRGVIVGAWGSVETTLKEIALRASKTDPYGSIDCRIPNSRSELVSHLRGVLIIEGPLCSIRNEIDELLSGYDQGANDRNLLAHAHMEVLGNWGATFKAFHAKRDKQGGDHFVYNRIRKTIGELDDMARIATELSHKAQFIRDRIDEGALLMSIG